MSDSEPKKQVRDVHFGNPKQIIFDNDGANIYSLGLNDGTIFRLIKDDFSADPVQILENHIQDQINAMCFTSDKENLLIAVKNQLKIVKDLPNISGISNLYTEEDSDIIGIVQDPQNGHILVNTETRATILQSNGRKLSTLMDSLDPIAWTCIAPQSHSIVIATDSNLFIYKDEKSTEASIKRLETGSPNPVFAPSSDLLVANPLRSGVVNIYNLTDNTESSIIITKHTSPITYLAVTKSSSIVSADRNGNIFISKFDRNVLKFAATSPAPQPIAVDVTLNYGSSNICVLATGGGAVICGDENGSEIFWNNVIRAESKSKPVSTEEKTKKPAKKNNTVSKKINIMDALTKKSDKQKDEDDEVSLSDEEPEKPKKPKLAPPPKPKPKPKPKAAPKKKKHDEYSEDEEEGFIVHEREENQTNFLSDEDEEQNAEETKPQEGPVITASDFLEEESETSSGHEIDDVDEDGNIIQKQSEELTDNEIPEEKAEEDTTDSDASDVGGELTTMTFQFMPNNCSHFSMNRRYMSWNIHAAVFLRAQNDSDEEFIDVHPITKGVIQENHYTNVHKFTIATCDKYGFMAASPHVLEYRPHTSWSQDAITTMDVNKEEIRVIACGKEWFAIGTYANTVRIFKSSGLEMGSFAYPHQIITMVGHDNLLVIVHGSELLFELIDIDERNTIASGEIPGDQPLKWIGFSEEGSPMILDGNLVVHMLVSDFGNSWVPVCDLKTYSDEVILSFWMVGSRNGMIYVCPMKHTKSPPTSRIPKTREFQISPLSVGFTSTAYLQAKLDTHTPQEVRENTADIELMRLLAVALQEGKEEFAADLITIMSTSRARLTALTYADQLGKRELVDRLTGTKAPLKSKARRRKSEAAENLAARERVMKFIEAQQAANSVYVRKDNRFSKNSVEVAQPPSFSERLAAIPSTPASKKSYDSFLKPPPPKGPVKKKTSKPKKSKEKKEIVDMLVTK